MLPLCSFNPPSSHLTSAVVLIDKRWSLKMCDRHTESQVEPSAFRTAVYSGRLPVRGGLSRVLVEVHAFQESLIVWRPCLLTATFLTMLHVCLASF